ncbi:hypothetical protein LZZ90_08225 [Flavobacterium sp. SM15]|uniref:imm11 family protein n=1 Tax=Flavobacterium sp. SM15 TaxID=2908005 RepID=UPI001EDA2B04|nr:DUF1629 domain-containing protein [Flavobacterium sp. SM15]MCG2611492.1 hypothetical protein [Flavobacterium sp. SM15]
MRYYSIQDSLDKKILGHNPQVKDVIYHCDVWEDPMFIDKFHFEKIDIEPIVANPLLHSKSNLTDLISTNSVIGFSFTKLISSKFKNLLESKRKTRLQFFQCSVYKDGIEHRDYWLLNVYDFNLDIIDFTQTKISVGVKKEGGGTERKSIEVQNVDEFVKVSKIHYDKMEVVTLDKIYINENVKEDFFFIKDGGKYVVSETFKKEIEDSGCTGIEFQPLELSINEWLQGGEREKVYGKA